MTSGKDLVSEVIQAVVALAVLIPTGFIAVYQAIHNEPENIPTLLAVAVGAVIAFYFRSVIVTRAANGQAVAQATQAATAAIVAAATVPPPPPPKTSA